MRSVYRPITLALALVATAALVPALAGDGPGCPRGTPPQPSKAAAAAPKAPTTAAAEPEKKEGLRRFKLEAL